VLIQGQEGLESNIFLDGPGVRGLIDIKGDAEV
jgi:hypothetical protein